MRTLIRHNLIQNILEISERLADEGDYESNLKPKMEQILEFLVETETETPKRKEGVKYGN